MGLIGNDMPIFFPSKKKRVSIMKIKTMFLGLLLGCFLVGCTAQTSQVDPEILEQYRQEEEQFYEDNDVIGTMKLKKSEMAAILNLEIQS